MAIIKASQIVVTADPTQDTHVLTKLYAENFFGNSILPIHFYHIGGFPESQTERVIYVGPGSIGFHYIPFAGKIVYLTISSTSAVTEGSLTAFITLDGTKQSSLNVVLNTTNPLNFSSSFSSGNTVNAGTRVGVVVTSTSDFSPNDSDIQIMAYIK